MRKLLLWAIRGGTFPKLLFVTVAVSTVAPFICTSKSAARRWDTFVDSVFDENARICSDQPDTTESRK